MKSVPALVFLWVLLVGAGWWAASGSRDDSALVETRASHHAAAAQLPLDDFLRDRANRLAGKVLDTDGNVVDGATVSLYDAGALSFAAQNLGSDGWLSLAPEVEITTDSAGEFEFQDLSYGGKVAVFGKPGYWGDVVTDVPFADGYGASGVDGTLRPASDPLVWTLRHSDGAVAAGLGVRLLPTSFSGTPVAVRTDEDGKFTVDPAAGGVSAPPIMLVGRPGALIAGSEEIDEFTLPGRSDLVLRVSGGQDGAAQLSLLPAGARRLGEFSTEMPISGSTVVLSDVFYGRYEIWLRQGGRIGWAEFTHLGEPLDIELQPSRGVKVSVRDEAGAPLHAGLAWQATPFGVGSAFAKSPFEIADHLHPYLVQTHTDESGDLTLTDLPAHGGHLLVETAGGTPVERVLEPGLDEIEVVVPASFEVSVRTQRPFLPVEIEVKDSPPQRGRTDAAGEAFAWAPHGPVVVRAGFARKGQSYPKGYAVGHAGEALSFSALDDRGRPRGCVYGFVMWPGGHPVEKAIVFAQGSGAPDRQETDEHGFFRFTALEAGPYVVFAAPPDQMSAYRQISTVLLSPLSPEEQGEARVDFELHLGTVSIGPVPSGGAPYAQLLDETGQVVWTGHREDDGMIWLRNVPPGSYRVVVFESEGDQGREVGSVELSDTQAEPVALSWEGTQ